MPPTAALQASINGGANQTGGITAADGDTVQLSGVSTVGWAQQRFEIYSFPPGYTVPAGWSTDGVTGAYFYSSSAIPPTFTVTPWGKFLFRLTIGVSSLGLGLDRDGRADPRLVDISCAISVPGPAGTIDLAWNETTQFSASKKWVAGQQANLRLFDAGLGGGVVPNTRNLIAGAGMTGGGDLQADRTFNVVANADGSIVVNANDVQVGILATDAQHGVRGGGTQHAGVTTTVNGFMLYPDKVKLDAAAATATAGVLALRGASAELLGAWFANAAAVTAGTASGVVRAAANVVIAAARIAAGGADHALLATDNTDVVLHGDLVRSAGHSLQMKAAGIFRLLANTTKILVGTKDGVAFGGDPDFGGGTGVISIKDADTSPTTIPTEGALLHVSHGGLYATSLSGVRMQMSPAGDAAGGAIRQIDQRNGYVTTNTGALSAVILSLTPPASLTDMTIDIDIVGLYSDVACHFTRKIRCRLIGSAMSAINSMTYTGIADDDTIGGCSIAVAANGAALEITVTGPTAKLVAWTADASRVRLFKA